MRRAILICVALAAITLFAFWPVGQLGFILFDDHHYVTENPNVQAGITADSIGWAFTSTQASNWHPITWLSHMLDFQLFGLNPAGHHWVNLGFHIANTLLLFIVLRQLTQTVWRSALVAALFALHPMRVESVAWISERKDVLSVFFAMLTLWAWTQYAQKPEVRSQKADGQNLISDLRPPASGYYWLALGFFALGLMSKPMLVTLPVILLLLDFWPLGRISDFRFQISDLKRTFQDPAVRRLIWEKSPFAVLSLASCIVTVWAQNNGGAVVAIDCLPWYWRAADALMFYTAYLGKIFWPLNLAIFYPYLHIPVWEFVCMGLVPILLTVFCILRARQQRWLLAGWCWFVVMLLPVIGLVQVGMQSIADRYTYLPSIGLFIALAWGMAGLAIRSEHWRIGMVLAATVLIGGCLLDIRHQLHYWRDNVTLFSRAAEITRQDNSMSNFLLGNAYAEAGDMAAAARSFRTTLQVAPDFEQAHDQLGQVLVQEKKFAEGEAQFGEILALNPYSVSAHKHLGNALAREGKYTEAMAEYSNALMIKPDDAVINHALEIANLKAENDKKLPGLYTALKILPTAETHTELAVILALKEEYSDAVSHYIEALRIKPDAPDVLNNLAWLLATCPDAHIRNGDQAVKHAERACELTHYKMTPLVGTLAAAYAEAGRYDEAISAAKKACALAAAAGDQNLLKRNQELLILYRAHQPYRETTSP